MFCELLFKEFCVFFGDFIIFICDIGVRVMLFLFWLVIRLEDDVYFWCVIIFLFLMIKFFLELWYVFCRDLSINWRGWRVFVVFYKRIKRLFGIERLKWKGNRDEEVIGFFVICFMFFKFRFFLWVMFNLCLRSNFFIYFY